MEQVKDLILTCDAGTTGLKCSLFNARGEAVRTVRRAYGTEYPHHNWAQQDPDVILENVYSGIRELLEQVSARRVACVGLSGHMNGCIPVDSEGAPWRPISSTPIRVLKSRWKRLPALSIRQIFTGLPATVWMRTIRCRKCYGCRKTCRTYTAKRAGGSTSRIIFTGISPATLGRRTFPTLP